MGWDPVMRNRAGERSMHKTDGSPRTAGHSVSHCPDQDRPASEAVRRIFDHLGELRAQATLYLDAERDRVKLVVRQTAVWAAIGVLGLIVGASLLAVATA